MKSTDKIRSLLLPFPDNGLYLLASLALVSTIGFHFGFSLTRWHLGLGAALYFLVFLAQNFTWANFLKLLLPLAWLLSAAQLVSLFLDFSFDGTQYHQEALIQISRGWNPFKEIITPDIWDLTWAVWLNSLPKLGWTLGGVVSIFLGKIEAAKFLSLYLFPVVLLKGAKVAAEDFQLTPAKAFAVGLAAAANPIVASQYLTLYMDGYVAALASLALLNLLSYLKRPSKSKVATLIVAMIMAGLAKYTNLFFLVAAVIILIGYQARANLRVTLKFGVGCLTIGAITFFILGFNPFVTNLVRYASLNYPMSSEKWLSAEGLGKQNHLKQGVADIIYSAHLPTNFEGRSRLFTFFYSLFSRSDHASASLGTGAKLKFPLSVTPGEWSYLGISDGRIGGFGPLSALLFLASFAGLLITWRKDPLLAIVAVSLLGAALFNPYGWWARYIGYLWMVVPLALVALFRGDSPLAKAGIGLGGLLFVVSLVNSLPIALIHLKHSRESTKAKWDQVEQAYRNEGYANLDIYFGGFREVLFENRIPFLPDCLEESYVTNQWQDLDPICFKEVYSFETWQNPLFSRLPPMHDYERKYWLEARKHVDYQPEPSPLFLSTGQWNLNRSASLESRRRCSESFLKKQRDGFHRTSLF